MASQQGRQGEIVPDEHCPKCKGPVVYNGNYFCDALGDGCTWAMSHHTPSTKRERETELRMSIKLLRARNDEPIYDREGSP